MSWYYLRQGSWDGWTEVLTSPDKGSRGGETAVGLN
jgi:hypothetical protein